MVVPFHTSLPMVCPPSKCFLGSCNDHVFLSIDACGNGSGDYSDRLYLPFHFSQAIFHCYGHSIKILELLTTLSIVTLGPQALGCLSLRPAYHFLNETTLHQQCSRHQLWPLIKPVPAMQFCLREICFLTARHDIDLRAKDIFQGLENSIADLLSRWHLSPSHQQHFAELAADFPTTFCPTQLFDFEIAL